MTNLVKILEKIIVPAENSKKVYGRILLNEFKKATLQDNKIRVRDVLHLAMVHNVPQFQEMLDASEYNLRQIQRRVNYSISNANGYWLVNGKRYNELNDYEKTFFNEFLNQLRIIK